MRAAIYCRISDDKEGREVGVQRQEYDCRELAPRHGAHEVQVFTDNDMGASTRSRTKKRPEFDRMIAAVQRGDFQKIIAYSNSRLTRRPLELEDLIRLHEKTGVVIHTVVSGDDDLSKADGRMVARIKASVDAAEVERTAERVSRAHLENAREGKPVGGYRPFGWDDDKVTLHPVESELARDAIRRYVNGEPLVQIVREWNDSGVRTTAGKEWTPQTMRQYLKNPRLVGWRIYRGEVLLDSDGKPVVGQWEPMVDEPTWEALQERITGAKGGRKPIRQGRRDRRIYLLTGIARCAICNGPVYGKRYRNNGVGYYYACSAGYERSNLTRHSVSASGKAVDALISRLVLARLSEAAPEAPGGSEWPGEAQLAQVQGDLTATLEQLGKGRISAERLFSTIERLEGEVAELSAQRKEWLATQAKPVQTQITPAQWDSMEPSTKRELVARCLSAVYIKPANGYSGSHFRAERVVPVWIE